MKGLSKVCDAADWFVPEMLQVVGDELRETPRFHRKQWEFAMIFRALRRAGALGPQRTGLSMGGGRELLLYALLRHVRQLVVTDLYDARAGWVEARAEDPHAFLMDARPFDVDGERLRALRMDMRSLEFPEESFDFAYSACAIEHIGAWPDFVRHLREVHRVLRPGGVYAFTTEFHYGPETLEHPANFVFSADYLDELLAASPFAPEPVCQAALAPHRANFPLPENLNALLVPTSGPLPARLCGELPHVQLLRGGLPYTSALFVLRKLPAAAKLRVAFPGLEASRAFVARGAAEYRRWIESCSFGLDPMGYLPGRSSAYVGKPAHAPDADAGRTVFHTEYLWLGGGRRSFAVALHPWPGQALAGVELELRVHRYADRGRVEVECPASAVLRCEGAQPARSEITIEADADYSYAFLAHLRAGDPSFQSVEASTFPASGPPDPAQRSAR